MTMKFGLVVPQGWQMDLAGIPDPADAYETMARVPLEAEALGYGGCPQSQGRGTVD